MPVARTKARVVYRSPRVQGCDRLTQRHPVAVTRERGVLRCIVMVDALPESVVRQFCHLRWIAVGAQGVSVSLAPWLLGVTLNAWALWPEIAILAVLNLSFMRTVRRGSHPGGRELLGHLILDIAAFAWWVAWSGGLDNPFASLLLVPVALSALALPAQLSLFSGVAALGGFLGATLIGVDLDALCHSTSGPSQLHQFGMMANFLVSAGIMIFFLTRIAASWRNNEREAAVLREHLARTEGGRALAAHAAAVAIELSPPLASLASMAARLTTDAAHCPSGEIAVLRDLLRTCRERLVMLSAPAERHSNKLIDLESAIQHWQLIRPTVELHRSGATGALPTVDVALGPLVQVLLDRAANSSERAGSNRVDLHIDALPSRMQIRIRDYGAVELDTDLPLPAAEPPVHKLDCRHGRITLSHATVERLGGSLSIAPADGPGVSVECTVTLPSYVVPRLLPGSAR